MATLRELKIAGEAVHIRGTDTAPGKYLASVDTRKILETHDLTLEQSIINALEKALKASHRFVVGFFMRGSDFV
jgi:hypothetical protein